MTSNKHLVMKNVVLAAALVAGMYGPARADDTSMSRLSGDSYAYFNAPRGDASAAQTWRLSHPNGFMQSELQALVNGVFAQRAHEPVFNTVAADPSWRPSHPDGLSERELQALSSEAPAWHRPNGPGTMTSAANGEANAAQAPGKEKNKEYPVTWAEAQQSLGFV